MSRPQPAARHSVPPTRELKRLRSRDWPRPPRRDPHVRVIACLSEFAGPNIAVVASSSRPWASATFIGAQHRVILRFAGDDAAERAARFADALPEAEFTIAGHIVADACVDEWGHAAESGGATANQALQDSAGLPVLRVTVLTVEDW
ncbi:hypothetical protein OOT33_00375 [Sphingobium sp. DEHP117]|uniref:hypothetical protein n=1 Tax=Sphingobium sp. DEHP117 TaxID=2993436 RepID=UPI0027D4ADE1|nr:hypothetical protein [Sphingobium sp. DEHP117]MDQ4418902.1 hypothetical protein [Sphingobium sp. DEHP117]